MESFYDEIEIEDFVFDDENKEYSYPCPCGDRFIISLVFDIGIHREEELECGEEIARCPSCSLLLKVIYDPADFEDNTDTINLSTITV